MSGPFKVGDTVIVEASYNESRYGKKFWEDTVAKVGRRYVYLHGDGRTAYNAQTGVQKTKYPGSARKIWTPEAWQQKERRGEVVGAIKSHGIRPDGYGDFKQSTDVLQRILEVLEEK
ncbi:hypothetical protein BTO20_11335 [Mycobacterium dioxanotrophicus]|uniref:Uncharacterized protein n=1 Tax=Mycobacterium dioxanotrophicus TaxID=482462 RepID=A0A1Y0C1V4_9MYCO|nr:hypothetical protein [Mycobacterium dioxanotrophicus]ART69097.1 hypothetical protein BTO20_11335 [Mycobacterium dioxanotrophicus]